VKSGDKVLVKQQQSDKLSLPYNPSIHTVIKRNGHEAVVKSDTSGRTYRRGMAHIKKYCEGDSTEAKSTENSDDKDRQLVLLLMRTATDRQFVLLQTRTILIRTTPMRTMLLVLADFRANRLI